MANNISRRSALLTGAAFSLGGCVRQPETRTAETSATPGSLRPNPNEEYAWIRELQSAFVRRRRPSGFVSSGKRIGREGEYRWAQHGGYSRLVATMEQTAARRPAGIMVVGWDPSALIPAINQAVESGIPVVCVDADVPSSKRLSFIGTDWVEIGRRQADAMLKALNGKKGKVAMLGLIEQSIDQQAIEGFRTVASAAGLSVMEPQQDKGNQGEAARVATALLQANPDLVGMAGFDSESGAGMGQAVRESGKTGQIIVTCVDAEPQQLRFIKEGVITASVGQKRALFTYQGVKALFEVVHNQLKSTADDLKAGISPIPVYYNTGTFIINRENVDLLLRGRA